MLILLSFLACGDKDPTGDSAEVFLDEDGDGFTSDVDCDDADPDHNPDTPELCNGVDDNCNGVADEDPSDGETYWFDSDGDGYGGQTTSKVLCEARDFYTLDNTDCDDTDDDVNPGAAEVCDDDDVDEDCDGVADDADDSVDTSTGSEVYTDGDGDGYGTGDAMFACDVPEGTAVGYGDCDDNASSVNPGATEVCDNGVDDDCDGTTNTCSPNGELSLGDYDSGAGGSSSLLGAAVSDVVDQQVAIGAPSDDGGKGQVQIVTAGFSTVELVGNRDQGAGGAVSLADVDDDGDADLLVGLPDDDDASGRVMLLHGPFSNDDLGEVAVEEWGGDEGDGVGSAVVLFDNDGEAGLAYGASGASEIWIEATIGGSSSYISATGAGDVLAAADWDGDGVDEVLAGVAGQNYVLVASLTTTNSQLVSAGLGSAVAGGDRDGDGTADIVAGAKSADSVSVFAGSTSSWLTVTGEGSFGSAVSVADLDADGQNDLIVGASAASGDATSQGAVYVFYAPGGGTLDAADAGAVLWGDGDFAAAGTALGSGDIDGDGDADLAVGAPGTDSLSGAAYLVTGGGF